VPAPHGAHASAFAPVYPALHSHALLVILPAREAALASQSEQIPGPKPSLNWFALHCEHATPFAPVYPALHLQEVFVMLPGGDIE